MPSAAGRRLGGLIPPTGAAEKAVPPQNGVGHTTLLGGTAYVSSIGGRRRLVAGLPQPVSHTRRVAASPRRPRRPAPQRPLEPPSTRLRLARPRLVRRRFPSRVLRDGSGLVWRLLSDAQTAGRHLSRLPQGADRRPCGRAASTGRGGAPPHLHPLRRAPALSRLSSLRLRRLAQGRSTHGRVGAAPGTGRQNPFGAHAVADRCRPSALWLAVVLASGQRRRPRTTAPDSSAGHAARPLVAGHRRRVHRLRTARGDDHSPGALPDPPVVAGDAVHGT